jgi:hypothetical protein
MVNIRHIWWQNKYLPVGKEDNMKEQCLKKLKSKGLMFELRKGKLCACER